MRVLLTTPTYPPFNSGLGNAVEQQAFYLIRAGHEVVVATYGKIRSTRIECDVTVERFAVKGSDNWLQSIQGETSSYLNFVRENKWDVVLLNAWQNWATDLVLINIDQISGKKILYSHCISTNAFYLHQPFRSILRYALWRPYWWRLLKYMKRLDGILFLASDGTDSRFDDLMLARRSGVPFQIVPNSLSPAAVRLLDNSVPSLDSRSILIAVGSYQWQKGFDFVLRAYAASESRRHFPLHLYGQLYTPYTDELRNLANELGLEDGCVVFHQKVSGEALLAEYGKAGLVLSGSHTECQPLVLLDAMATGTPFVARATGCISMMPGGEAVRSFQEMASRMDDLLINSTSAWDELSLAGRQAADRIYRPNHVSDLLLKALGL